MVEIRYYVDDALRSPFEAWFGELTDETKSRVSRYLARVEAGNFSAAKGVSDGVYELRMDFGPGYRVYFGKDGETIVILLGGGTKRRQQNDIRAAHRHWLDYKRMKKGRQDANDKKLQ